MNRPLTQLELRHEENRQNLWVNAWLSVARSTTCLDKTVPTSWADQALKDYDERFPKLEAFYETQCGFIKKDDK